MENKNLKDNTTQTITIAAQSHKLLINNKEAKSKVKKSTMLFNADEQAMTIIQHENKEYMVMDRHMIDKVSNKMDEAMKKMKEQMANMPAQQRAMMEKMLKATYDNSPKQKEQKMDIRKTSKMEAALGKKCVIYEVYKDNMKKSELCVVAWNKLKNSIELQQSIIKLSQFYQDIFSHLTKKIPLKIDMNYFRDINKLNGLPIIIREFNGADIVSLSLVKTIQTKQFNKSDFMPPANYKKKTMMH